MPALLFGTPDYNSGDGLFVAFQQKKAPHTTTKHVTKGFSKITDFGALLDPLFLFGNEEHSLEGLLHLWTDVVVVTE